MLNVVREPEERVLQASFTLPVNVAKAQLQPSWARWLRDFVTALRADDKSMKTLETYAEAVIQFHGYLVRTEARVPAPTTVAKDHVRGWLIEMKEAGRGPATRNNRFRGLHRFFSWMVAEEELAVSPMEGLTPPAIPETPIPVMAEEAIRQLLKLCSGNSFDKRRDKAILSVLIDCGVRRGELATMKLSKLDMDLGRCEVLGKGSRARWVYFSTQTARDLQRYLRARDTHPRADVDWLWLGQRGPLQAPAIRALLERLYLRIGINPKSSVHVWRHTWAHMWKSANGSTEDLMAMGGWRSAEMAARYGRSAATERAAKTQRMVSPRDRLE